MSTQAQSFRRPDLAKRLARQILASPIGSAAPSGVFLAAPRRTGKSTFLREDLAPVLESMGALTLYVDLWANKTADPSALIEGAVRDELSKHEGVIKRLAKGAGIEKVSVGGMGFSLDRVGLGKDVSLSTALAALSDEIKQPIVLLIDEAQHAITTEAGYNTLFALKAARDELNSSAHHGLRIVATGSNRDKLAMLRNSKDQAFYLSPLVAFPHLDLSFIQWFCEHVNLPSPLGVDQVMSLFQNASFRPEILFAASDALRFDVALDPNDVPSAFAIAVSEQLKDGDDQALQVIHSLTPLQASVLRVLAHKGAKFAPFEETTLTLYQEVLTYIAPSEKVKAETSNIQQALGALQEKGLVWRERRGVYALEDMATKDLMAREGMLAIFLADPEENPIEKWPKRR